MAVTNKYRHTNTALCHYWFYGHPARILALVLQLYERNRPKLKLKQTRGLKKTTILYDYLTIMPTLRLTYDKRLIYKTSYKERKAFVRYDSLAKL